MSLLAWDGAHNKRNRCTKCMRMALPIHRLHSKPLPIHRQPVAIHRQPVPIHRLNSKPLHHIPCTRLIQAPSAAYNAGNAHPQHSYPNAAPIPAQHYAPQQHATNHSYHSMPQSSSNAHNQVFLANKQGTPTLFAAQGFDPVKDAHDLRKAMKGFGTDEDKLIEIICRRTNEQRQEIQRQYKTHFGKDLIEDIKSETSGNFEKLLVGLLRPIVDYYCAELNDAMAGIGTDEEVLIEILCTLSNVEIHTIKHQYLRLYGAHLESELKSETSGNFKRLLTSLCTAARDESGRVDVNAAKDDARELLKAGELRVGTDESMFNMILCQRNYQQLKLIFQEYESMTGHSLEKAIKKEFSGDIMEGLIAIYRCVTNKAEYFASRLHKAMAGIGTNDKQLIRVIITRCEIDMSDIKVAFERLYGKSLKSWIKGDTSGHYKHALYAIVGEQRSS
ncbi:annexin B11 isoform X1 [Drosophila busckii]|uniref:annexin B11 isoform X1 n=1 Tax=Drosophila busckii TaxID=30019 RepID=UPI0014330035|nr:annexin B11 isoform X1 [Drosophila busckii]XP_017852324.2 annexin B11 isoform X1 [Drosophila busckii]XP_017852325.2 annexin B11 isoform X1 [Drosophila busckii]